MSNGVRFLYNTTKVYPDMIKVIIYKEPMLINVQGGSKRNKEVVDEDYTPDVTSLRRTKTLIKDIILSNDFEYFCTFTFDPKKCDRFSFASCYHKMSTWLHHQADLSRSFGEKQAKHCEKCQSQKSLQDASKTSNRKIFVD